MLVVAARILNESELLPVFLENYSFADYIILADGGSTDNSKKIAKSFKKAEVFWYDFPVKVPGKNGGWRNPEGQHVKFALEHAESFNPDWIWFTEIDAIPNLNFQRDIRFILQQADFSEHDLVNSWLCYVAPGSKEHYPSTMLGVGYTAWKSNKWTVTNIDDPFEGQGSLQISGDKPLDLGKEYSRIHLTFESEELVTKKSRFYSEVHDWNLGHPDSRCGPREALPEWATWLDPRNKCCGFGGYKHLGCNNE